MNMNMNRNMKNMKNINIIRNMKNMKNMNMNIMCTTQSLSTYINIYLFIFMFEYEYLQHEYFQFIFMSRGHSAIFNQLEGHKPHTSSCLH